MADNDEFYPEELDLQIQRSVEAYELANLLTVAKMMDIAPAGSEGNVGFAGTDEARLLEGYRAFAVLSSQLGVAP